MNHVVDLLTHQHSHRLIALAAIVCAIGSCLSVLLARRLVMATGRRKRVQLVLTSLIGGATIWSTHFISMLAYDPGFDHAFEPVKTALSLAVAFLGMMAANALLGYRARYPYYVLSGTLLGVTISVMHYVGMSAYLVPGDLVWDTNRLIVSVLLGIGLGVATHHRIAFPFTKYCWLGGAIFMAAAICTMHFFAMSAFEVQLDPNRQMPPQVILDTSLAMIILAIMVVVLMVGFAAVSIETNLEVEAKGRLQHASMHDPLTGLPNRMLLNQRMTELSDRFEQGASERVALLSLDLNSFKEINDLYGHAAGDIVLKIVASRLSGALEENEFLARTGGDGFVAIKRGFRRSDEVLAFAERLHTLIMEPIDLQVVTTSVGASIGIATSLDDGLVMRELQHKSDLALHRAKAEPDHHICFFNADIDQQGRDKLLLVSDLRQATAKGEFELVYQLQNDLETLEPTGFEVLLRWNHPQRGLVSPGDFIPIAEETGLIREIGLWVLRTACHEAAQWPVPLSVAVNVAPQQLVQPSFFESVSDILMESRLPPERLEIEVTEASIIDDQARTLKVMHRLKDLGIRIAMDDFGTGYSSLATLQAFPFDKIKVDRSFIRDVHNNPQRAAIVRATLLLGAALNIPVLAEGVEVEGELDFLRAEKCSAVQGFYFGKPKSVAGMRQIVDAEAIKKAS